MFDFLLVVALCFCAFWLGGKVAEADLAQDCLRDNVVQMDTVKFSCIKQAKE